MLPDDPRHGTVAGYNRIPCRDECCKKAMATYKARWAWDQMNGRSRIVDTTGTRRRIEALMALGWSGHEIGRRLGMTGNNVTRLRKSTTLTAAMAARIAKLYDQMSMALPDGNAQAISNVRNLAKKRGYLPPLAWDDDRIDDPTYTPEPVKTRTPSIRDEVDEIAVERFLTGDHGVRTTRAERVVIVAEWKRLGRPMADLERAGWKWERYIEREDGAA